MDLNQVSETFMRLTKNESKVYIPQHSLNRWEVTLPLVVSLRGAVGAADLVLNVTI